MFLLCVLQGNNIFLKAYSLDFLEVFTPFLELKKNTLAPFGFGFARRLTNGVFPT